MNNEHHRPQEAWGNFRLSVVGHLLASPPPRGQLQSELKKLARKTWRHPTTGEPVQFDVSTIEGWYYAAKNARQQPVVALASKRRRDVGEFRTVSEPVREEIARLHRAFPGWSHQLHYDNLRAVASQKGLGTVPSYPTVRRYRKARGMLREKPPRQGERAGMLTAREHLESREQRSFESTHVLGLVHSDFHHCSRKLVNGRGEWAKPVLVAFLDDRSRLVCHAQWYWHETAENFVHALSQAILKRGLPRALMTDNGSPMTAAETTQGLRRLSIVHETTLPYTPQQNGKQESFWAQIEGRLMAMLEGEPELTLDLLNRATTAWVEMDYHRRVHSETGQTPLQRFLDGPDVARPTPSFNDLQMAFTVETTRSLRRNDCTISLEGRRFEVPSAYRHMQRIHLRFAHWDLSHIYLVNAHSGAIIGRLFPRDLEKNADGRRRRMQAPAINSERPPTPGPAAAPFASPTSPGKMAPLLRQNLLDCSATGLPMAYLTKEDEDA